MNTAPMDIASEDDVGFSHRSARGSPTGRRPASHATSPAWRRGPASRMSCDRSRSISSVRMSRTNFPQACADWVAATTEAAASRVCDSALDALVRSLDSLLIDVPPDVARRLDEQVRHDAGFA